MFKRPSTDLWRVGVAPIRMEQLSPAALAQAASLVAWLPDPGPWRYLADPFAVMRDEHLHVFVEAFDYRTKRAVIEQHRLRCADLQWVDQAVVLSRECHLSYPFVFEHAGSTYMVPESHQAGEVVLYQAQDPQMRRWERVGTLMSGQAYADASLIEHAGAWWMFYTIVGPGKRDQRELHVARSPSLLGPWQAHEHNPIVNDARHARPAGRPYVDARSGHVLVPVQDCSQTYGGATRLLRFGALASGRVTYRVVPGQFTAENVCDSHQQGLHTLSGCGPYTLFDVKRVDRSRGRQWIDLQRRLRRLFSR